MSTSTERPTLPKGWEWTTPANNDAVRRTSSVYLYAFHHPGQGWRWWAGTPSHKFADGLANTAPLAAEAAERAVVEFAKGLIAEVEG